MEPTAAEPEHAPTDHAVDVPVLVRRTQDLLASGVPLTLLLDLVEESGPRSHDRYVAEGGDADWLPR